MTSLEAAIAVDTPERAQARFFLALANAAMAAIVGAWTLGPVAAVAGAVAMLALPYLPALCRIVPELIRTNRLASAGAFFILGVAAGTVLLGIKFAFFVALVLAPVMLLTVCVLARANSLVN